MSQFQIRKYLTRFFTSPSCTLSAEVLYALSNEVAEVEAAAAEAEGTLKRINISPHHQKSSHPPRGIAASFFLFIPRPLVYYRRVKKCAGVSNWKIWFSFKRKGYQQYFLQNKKRRVSHFVSSAWQINDLILWFVSFIVILIEFFQNIKLRLLMYIEDSL